MFARNVIKACWTFLMVLAKISALCFKITMVICSLFITTVNSNGIIKEVITMKKFITIILLSVTLLFSLCACSDPFEQAPLLIEEWDTQELEGCYFRGQFCSKVVYSSLGRDTYIVTVGLPNGSWAEDENTEICKTIVEQCYAPMQKIIKKTKYELEFQFVDTHRNLFAVYDGSFDWCY